MWNYKDKIITSINDVEKDAIGFIYIIENLTNGKHYLGKKFLYSNRKKNFTKKEIAAMENKRLKKWKTITTESDWLSYCGSSKPLLEDIKNGHQIAKFIITFCKSKIALTYQEVKHLFLYNVLENDEWYNDNINGRWFKGNIT